jgi:hypothetical protein
MTSQRTMDAKQSLARAVASLGVPCELQIVNDGQISGEVTTPIAEDQWRRLDGIVAEWGAGERRKLSAHHLHLTPGEPPQLVADVVLPRRNGVRTTGLLKVIIKGPVHSPTPSQPDSPAPASPHGGGSDPSPGSTVDKNRQQSASVLPTRRKVPVWAPRVRRPVWRTKGDRYPAHKLLSASPRTGV